MGPTAWWYGPHGHIYTSRVDNPTEIPAGAQMFEIIANTAVDQRTNSVDRASWGIGATNEFVEAHFKVSLLSYS